MKQPKDYIKDFQEKVTSENEAKKSFENDLVARGLDSARSLLPRWLGECWGTIFKEKEMRAHFSNNGGNLAAVRVIVDIVYESDQGNVNGKISFSFVYAKGTFSINTSDTPKIDFGYFRSVDSQNITADLWITNNALLDTKIKDDDLGLLFWKLEELIKAVKREGEERRQYERNRALDFELFKSIAAADKAFNERVGQLPELRNEIKAAFDRRVAEIREDARKEQEWEQEQARLAARRELLSAYAARAWEENGFFGYEIQYGARVDRSDPEESPIYTDSIFSLESMPAPDGFFTAYNNGKTFRFRPQNIIGIREIPIRSYTDAPYQLRRFVKITDGEVVDECAFPPAAVFTIDPAFLPKNHEK